MPAEAPSIRRSAVLAVAVAAGLALGLASPAMAAFPGTNGLIAFERDGQIWVQTPGNVSSQRSVATIGNNQDPVWSPDGTRIAFASDRQGGVFHIFVQAVDGPQPVSPVTTGSADQTAPAWSPDGTRIAFQEGSDPDLDIVVVSLRGEVTLDRVVVASGPGREAVPTWSADGSRILFGDGDNVSVVNANGSGRGPFAANARRPDVAPDGSRVVVSRDDQVTLLNGDGSGGQQLTFNGATSPVFSPDGQRIVFADFVGPPNGYDLFTVGASVGATVAPETVTGGNDFAPDWQPIGPAPLINQLTGPLYAASPGATLTVDGAGFVRRSVVRWNTSNRPTTFVNSGRLTAALTAADVAAVGTGQVTVFTSPLGGGLSPAATATIVPPPPPPGPRILVSSAKVSAKWAQSRVRGAVRITGSLERAAKIEIALLSSTRVVRSRVVTLPKGAFSIKLVLSGKLAPGPVKLRLREVGGAPAVAALAGDERSVTIPAPPEGVVSEAIVSATSAGPAALTLRNKSKLFARFRFVALPRKGKLTTTWIAPSGQSKTNARPRTRIVGAEVSGRNRQFLPKGVWRCVLKAGKRVIAVARVRLS